MIFLSIEQKSFPLLFRYAKVNYENGSDSSIELYEDEVDLF